MTTNSQLSTPEPKKQTKTETKQTTIKGTESQKWRPHGCYQLGSRRERMEETVQGLKSINGRYKIDRGKLKIV